MPASPASGLPCKPRQGKCKAILPTLSHLRSFACSQENKFQVNAEIINFEGWMNHYNKKSHTGLIWGEATDLYSPVLTILTIQDTIRWSFTAFFTQNPSSIEHLGVKPWRFCVKSRLSLIYVPNLHNYFRTRGGLNYLCPTFPSAWEDFAENSLLTGNTLSAAAPITCELLNKQVKVSADMAIFITMNPGYAGRSNLPDNLKKLFRSLAMTKPDRQLIAQVMLYSQGFRTAEVLANKIVPFFK